MSKIRSRTPSFRSKPFVSPQIADSVRKWLRNWNIRSGQMGKVPPAVDQVAIKLDTSNRITLVDPFSLAKSANGEIQNGAYSIYINSSGTNRFAFGPANNGTKSFSLDANGNIDVLGGVTTTGLGTPALVADPAGATGLTAANTNFINYTPPAAAGKYLILWSVDCTVATTDNFHAQITFKDASGNAINQTCGGFDKAGTGLVAGAITNTIGTGVYYGFMIFSIDNSATAITLSTAGTFTTVTYNLDASLYRLA